MKQKEKLLLYFLFLVLVSYFSNHVVKNINSKASIVKNETKEIKEFQEKNANLSKQLEKLKNEYEEKEIDLNQTTEKLFNVKKYPQENIINLLNKYAKSAGINFKNINYDLLNISEEESKKALEIQQANQRDDENPNNETNDDTENDLEKDMPTSELFADVYDIEMECYFQQYLLFLTFLENNDKEICIKEVNMSSSSPFVKANEKLNINMVLKLNMIDF